MANNFMMIPSICWPWPEEDEELVAGANLVNSRKPTFSKIKEILDTIGFLRKHENESDWKKEKHFALEVFDGKSFLFEISAFTENEDKELEVLFLGRHSHNPFAQLIFVHEVSKRFGTQILFCDSGVKLLAEPDCDIEFLKKIFIEKFNDMYAWHEDVRQRAKGS